MIGNFKQELLKAKAGKYALPAFNFDNFEMMKGIIMAAEATHSPVILMVTESSAKAIGLDYVFDLAKNAAQKAQVPVILHWDHGFDLGLIKRAVDAGFSSVMLDASLKSFDDNVQETIEVVKYAHQKNVHVESEIGHVGGKEDDRESKGNGYTDLEEAIKFNQLTHVDALAVAVGTSHGVFKSKPELQFDLIKSIVKHINTPIVLHGSSGVPISDLQKAISCGITKINIGTDLKMAAAEALKNWFDDNPQGYDARQYCAAVSDAVMQVAKKKIIAFGANNKI